MENVLKKGVSCFNVSGNKPVKLFLDDQQRYNSVTVGNGSYIVNASLEFGGGRANHVLVGNYTSIAHDVVFLSGYNHDHSRACNYPFDDFLLNGGRVNTYVDSNRYQIIIGNDVWIGRGVTVLGGTVIGNGAVVGANAVVSRDVPPYAIVVGNPARVVSYRFPLHVIEKMQQIKWWYWTRAQINKSLQFMKNPEEFVERYYDKRLQVALTPVGQQIMQLKASGKLIFFIPVDFESNAPVYEHVFHCYVKTYKKSDDTVLVFGCSQDDALQKLQALCNGQRGAESPDVLPVKYDVSALINILGQIDAVVTTRENISSFCVDYAFDHNAKIYFGLDENVFVETKLREKCAFAYSPPLLTIGIPTYNRLKYLKKSLSAVLEAVGNNPDVEILVSDNDSTDKTAEFVSGLQRRYSNLIYHKNHENIGGNLNFLKIYGLAHGKFVLAVGDDDNLQADAVKKLLEIIETDEKSSIILLRNIGGEFKTFNGSGTVEYMRIVSFWTTFISGIVFRKSAFESIPNPELCDSTNLNQVYFQLSVLKTHPHFCILFGKIFRDDSGQHKPYGYNFSKVFIKEYLDIIEQYAGLPREDMSKEKLRLFNEMLVPWLNLIVAGKTKLNLDGFADVFDQYYKREPYYQQASNLLKQIKVIP